MSTVWSLVFYFVLRILLYYSLEYILPLTCRRLAYDLITKITGLSIQRRCGTLVLQKKWVWPSGPLNPFFIYHPAPRGYMRCRWCSWWSSHRDGCRSGWSVSSSYLFSLRDWVCNAMFFAFFHVSSCLIGRRGLTPLLALKRLVFAKESSANIFMKIERWNTFQFFWPSSSTGLQRIFAEPTAPPYNGL